MLRQIWIVWYIIATAMLAACSANATTSPQPSATAIPIVKVSPTTTATRPAILVTCADVDANWGQDWAIVLDVLDQLIEVDQSCGEEPLVSQKYAAHFNYAASLEAQGDVDAAIDQYRSALTVDPQRREAIGALIRLEALPRPTPPTCMSTSPPLPDPAPAQSPDTSGFVKVEQGQLLLEGKPFSIKGVNYYPRQAPWERFFSEASPAAMAEEMDVLQAAGINTLRVFLWYQPLFTCQPEAAIPNEAAFELVDTVFRLAHERDLKLIISLNDLPDLIHRPLYTDWDHYDNQTTYIVRRYRNEPSLLAWDVRNGPDFDLEDSPGRFTEADISAWLTHITDLIRKNDPHHLITAGWLYDPLPASSPYVDILAFQHWEENETLAQRLADYNTRTRKPLLLIAAGEHSWPNWPDSPQDEVSQADYLQEITGLAEANKVGWVLWTAFDFVPAPGQPDNHNFHFGLWRTDLTPKRIVEKLHLEP